MPVSFSLAIFQKLVFVLGRSMHGRVIFSSHLFSLSQCCCHNTIIYKDFKLLQFYCSNLRGEWPGGLNIFRQVTEIKLGLVRSDSGWVTLEA